MKKLTCIFLVLVAAITAMSQSRPQQKIGYPQGYQMPSLTLDSLLKLSYVPYSAVTTDTVLYKAPDGTVSRVKISTGGGGGAAADSATFATKYYVDTNITRQQHVFNVKTYGARGNGVIGIDGGINSGSAVFTSPAGNFTTADVGKYIKIRGAGASGNVLVTTISARTSATTVTLAITAGTSVSGARFCYGTNDQTAIQAAINAAFVKGGKVYLPNGVYVLASGLVHSDNNGYDPNSQLFIPSQDMLPGTPQGTYRAIWIEGETPTASFEGPLVNSHFDQVNSGVILESFLKYSQVTGSYPAILGTMGATNVFSNTNLTDVYVRNIYTRSVHDPVVGKFLSGQMLRYAGNTNIADCFDGADVAAVDLVEPTTASVGFAPTQSNQGSMVMIRNCISIGNRIGFTYGEHTYTEDCQAIICYYGHDWQEAGHSSHATKIMSHWCKYDISAGQFANGYGSGYCWASADLLTVEQWYAGWNTHVATFYDPSNLIRGNWWYTATQSGTGAVAPTLVGAANLRLHHITENIVTDHAGGADVKALVQGVGPTFRVGGGTIPTGLGLNLPGEIVLNVGSDGVSVDGVTYSSALYMNTNQTVGVDGLLPRIIFNNTAIGASDKRAFDLTVQTDGATNTTRATIGVMDAGTFEQKIILDKNGTVLYLTTYANDAAADADASLKSGALYKVTGNRAVFQKP